MSHEFDPHDPHGRLQAIVDEFHARPDHQQNTGWQPGDPIHTQEAMAASQEYFTSIVAARRKQEEIDRAESLQRYEHHKREERRKRIKRAITYVAVVAAGLSIFAPGVGAIDRIGDGMSDAKNVAEVAIANPQDEMREMLDSELYNDLSEAQKRAQIKETNVEQVAARQTVIDLVARADTEGYEQIVAEVAEEKRKQPALFMPEKDITAAINAIEDAKSTVDVIDALDDFMSYYGISAGFAEGEFTKGLGPTKDIAKGYIDVFSRLPKDLIEKSQVEKVTISDHSLFGSADKPGEAGSYSVYHNTINIVLQSAITKLIASPDELIRGEDFSPSSCVAHELGHAIALHYGVPIENGIGSGDELHTSLPDDQHLDVFSRNSNPFKVFYEGYVEGGVVRSFTQNPEVPSLYSRTDSGEYNAELLAGLLSDTKPGLATVDEWRRFKSGSNKAMLQALADLEELRPGMAKIIMANRVSK